MEVQAERLCACRYSRVANMIEIEVEIDAELPAAEVQGIAEQIDRLEEVAEMQVGLPVPKSFSSHEGSMQSHHQCHTPACTIFETNALFSAFAAALAVSVVLSRC